LAASKRFLNFIRLAGIPVSRMLGGAFDAWGEIACVVRIPASHREIAEQVRLIA